jgi:hypothetical protein
MYLSQTSRRAACKQVADKYGVSAETLRSKLRRAGDDGLKDHGNQLLSNHDEHLLASLVECLALSLAPLNRQQLKALVRAEWDLSEDQVQDTWVGGFINRHRDRLEIAVGHSLDRPANMDATLDTIHRFSGAWTARMLRISYNADFIINADETPVGKKQLVAGKVIGVANALKTGAITLNENPLRTVIPFVAASGRVWFSLYIFSAVHLRELNEKTIAPRGINVPYHDTRKRGTWPRYYASTENGYMTNELWLNVLDILSTLVNAARSGMDVLLLVDHHATHHHLPAIKLLHKHNIECMFVPAKMTYLMQPLDVHVNGLLKRTMQRLAAPLLTSCVLQKRDTTCVVQTVLPSAEVHALMKEVIQGAWKATGLYYPHNPKVVEENIEKHILELKENARSALDESDEARTRSVMKHIMAPLIVVDEVPVKCIRVPNTCIDSRELEDLAVVRAEVTAQNLADKETAREQMVEKKRKRQEEASELERVKKAKFAKLCDDEKIGGEIGSAARTARKCLTCEKLWMGGKAWHVCLPCGKYVLCPDHSKDVDIIQAHNLVCQQSP